ncbi:hypothetical protein CEXT_131171, partial [Caerostris extrusa]
FSYRGVPKVATSFDDIVPDLLQDLPQCWAKVCYMICLLLSLMFARVCGGGQKVCYRDCATLLGFA